MMLILFVVSVASGGPGWSMRSVSPASPASFLHRTEVLDDVDPFCTCRFMWRAWVEHGSRSGAPEYADFYLRGREVLIIATYRFKQEVSGSSVLRVSSSSC